ncbi:UDP-glucose/GDP-mannose dehydrogenase family protein [Luteimonas yindakuii]|uniref:UDP-glucose dehydrogenase family protein n=1 Tax=Luteimonas yindakuii TaxID=2565782 RepID=UPI0011079449|nr:UDP-glucose/GDP-mannose dehydrogenase family protein [Luteimonas yindakuii]QCU72793.1 UDP-glucose/GDP-mannose dehydrogenase family protein [Luteimonas yindakuii]
MRVTMFGTGYVGLVTGACLAEIGHEVTCVDVDAGRITRLQAGEIPIYEPGLAPLVRSNAAAGRLHFTVDPVTALEGAEIVFIAVGTPPNAEGGADLSQVLAVAETIGAHLSAAAIVVNKSTVPVGTAQRVHDTINAVLARRDVQLDVDVASNPEFLKEGAAVKDCMHPDRIVLGASRRTTFDRLRRLYAPFVRNHDRFVEMDVRSAELTKYAANALLATKISFMNEMSRIAEQVGADIEQVRLGIGPDPRIGWHFIYAGAGYGGVCFPKDVQALARAARDSGAPAALLEAVHAVNDRQKRHLYTLIERHYGGPPTGKTFALWGAAFKPNTDDVRGAPSLTLLQQLWDAGATVRVYDPKALDELRRTLGDREDLVLCDTPAMALDGCDALVVVTEWREFRSPDLELMRERIGDRVVFDGRNIYDPVELEEHGIAYYGIGRGRSLSF